MRKSFSNGYLRCGFIGVVAHDLMNFGKGQARKIGSITGQAIELLWGRRWNKLDFVLIQDTKERDEERQPVRGSDPDCFAETSSVNPTIATNEKNHLGNPI
jgi:hypothetical protein